MKNKLLAGIITVAISVSMMPSVAFAGIVGHTHDGVNFLPLTNENISQYIEVKTGDGIRGYCLKPGSYYLAEDIQVDKWIKKIIEDKGVTQTDLNKSIIISGLDSADDKVNLCLNGHVIDGTADPAVTGESISIFRITGLMRQSVKLDGELNLYDCGTTIHKFVEDASTGKWALADDAASGEGVHSVKGGCITNASMSGIEIEGGLLNIYNGNIIGNTEGVWMNTGAALNIKGGKSVINGNVNGTTRRNLAIGFIAGESVAASNHCKINVDESFDGYIGVTTLADSYYKKYDYGQFTTANTNNLKDKFFADNTNYEIIRNENNCLEVACTAKATIKDQNGNTLKTYENQYLDHEITLPTELKNGYSVSKYSYTEDIFAYTAQAGEKLAISQKDFVITATLAIKLKQQPSLDNDYTVATDAQNVSYQWYKKEEGQANATVATRENQSKYYADIARANSGTTYHISFPDGEPANLTFDIGTATATGTNTYDVTPGFAGFKAGYLISMSADEPINVTATYEDIVDTAISNQTGASLTDSEVGTQYFCRVSDANGITGDSELITAEEKPVTPPIVKTPGKKADEVKTEPVVEPAKEPAEESVLKEKFIAQGIAAKAGKTSIQYSWNALMGATKYKVYFAKCGGKKYKNVKTTSSTSFKVSGLKKGSAYKFYVVAVDESGEKISRTPTIHVATKGGKASNATELQALEGMELKMNETFQLDTKITKKDGKKKLLNSKHGAKITYFTSDKSVASVDAEGNVSAVKAGKAYIYAMARSGVCTKCIVTVCN